MIDLYENARIRLLTGTTREYTKLNPILLEGELGIEKCKDGQYLIKVGDGHTKFLDLTYITVSAKEKQALIDIVASGSVPTGPNSSVDLTAITNRVATLEADTHKHNNKMILDATTASFTVEDKTKLDGLSNYDDSDIKTSITTLETDKVDKVDGKGLSTEDFTTEEKAKLAAITGFVSIRGRVDTIDDLNNIQNPQVGWLYFVGLVTDTDFVEYCYTESNTWEKIGTSTVDLSAYYLKTEIDTKLLDKANSADVYTKVQADTLLDDKVDKVDGKGLSTNDYTTEEKTKLANLSNYDDTAIRASITALDTGKVAIIDGMGLSSNDFTTAEKTKLANLSNYDDTDLDNRLTAVENVAHSHTNADILNATTASFTAEEKTKLASLNVDGGSASVDLTEVTGRIVALETASHTHTNSDVLNATTASFTAEDKTKLDSLTNYDDTSLTSRVTAVETGKVDKVDGMGLSSNDFTTAEKNKLAAISNILMLKGTAATVDELPADAEIGWVYLVGAEGVSEFSEYVYTENGVWEFVGYNNIDLSGYVQKEDGMGLSSNDYTTEEKTKLAGLENYDDTAINSSIATLAGRVTPLETASHTHTNSDILNATTASYTVEEKAKLDTLSNYNDTDIKTSIASLETGKVSAVEGMGLSSNDYTTEEKTKLAGLENYDDTALAGRVTTLESDTHKHDNADVLAATTASFTVEEKEKLAALTITDDSTSNEESTAVIEPFENKITNVTLYANGWVDGVYTITSDAITDSNIIFISLPNGVSSEIYDAVAYAQIVSESQTNRHLSIRALGTVPTVDIDIVLIIGEETETFNLDDPVITENSVVFAGDSGSAYVLEIENGALSYSVVTDDVDESIMSDMIVTNETTGQNYKVSVDDTGIYYTETDLEPSGDIIIVDVESGINYKLAINDDGLYFIEI